MKHKYSVVKTPMDKTQKAKRLATMKEARTKGSFSGSHDYLVMANRISGQRRIEARTRVNKIIVARTDQRDGR